MRYHKEYFPWKDYQRWCVEEQIHIFSFLNSIAAECTQLPQNGFHNFRCTREDYSEMYSAPNNVVQRFGLWTPIESFSNFSIGERNYQILFNEDFRMMNPINKTSNKVTSEMFII